MKHLFMHKDGKTVYGLIPGTTVIGTSGDGRMYVLNVEAAGMLYKGIYALEKSQKISDLTKFTVRPKPTNGASDVALVIIVAPQGAVERVVRGSPTPVLRILHENDGDSAVAIILEMTAGQRVEILTRTNSSELIDFDTDLLSKMRATTVR